MSEYPTRLQRTTNTQSASWFLDLKSAGRLDLDPPYQRRSVWNLQYKQFFIDSIIRNYPAPSIFLQVDYVPGQAATYHVIDGKQRLSALFEFYEDEFSTSDGLTDLGLDNKYYSQLGNEQKVALIEYVFTVESIKSASPAELNEAFDRLNRNVARLNKQELRHAKYSGAFVSKIERLSEHPFWTEIGLVTPARIRRMLDVEYVSELYIISMMGIQDGKDYLDSTYARNDAEIAGESDADENFTATQAAISQIDKFFQIKTSRFSNVADFYSLWASIADLVRSGEEFDAQEAASSLSTFENELEDQETERARSYRIAAVQGSNKKSNREIRADILRSVLKGM
ncbi:DUF262 domain-containing protein [Amycolatopsis sp. FDAARGOS 1241]|uniref:DUF262 domain-containing protein n=1 Tax=Amycolatopsis sp. FDAARGOS 1241 TaxID=2778070 RepID=UPI00195059DB|nr:DUF262 domain-containing protein [Amycolatopsis sp. FDAARGOS 1241]QRP47331.1 DUF262 domain-containing protein [Amycolatopsis sp. FDAARGOS 1241]